jgi:hypothetical protein
VPGTAALNLGGRALVRSVSCPGADSCAAGGYYEDGPNHYEAFVANEKNGVWRKAVEVPGTAALNLGGNAAVLSISCARAGSCAAGGVYEDGTSQFQAFVANKRRGVWRTAVEVPGTAVLNLGGRAEVDSVSCARAGSCTAGGYYEDGPNHSEAFVANEKNGVWRKAVEVPGMAALNLGGQASLNSISCVGAGSCAAGGSYHDGSNHSQAFVTKR